MKRESLVGASRNQTRERNLRKTERKRCKSMTTDHVAHRIFLEPELVGKVKEDVFYFLRGDGYLTF